MTFTATRDLVLPTTVTGSWPRPRWYDGRLRGQPLSSCMRDVEFREQFTDALAVVIEEQERAGLDILTHGDYFHDEDIAGHSWLRYPLERWAGFDGDYLKISPELPVYPAGSILNEVVGGMRWPRVVGRIGVDPGRPLEYAKIWRLAQARASRPVRFGTVCVQSLSLFLEIVDGYEQGDFRSVIWDMATAMNQELRELAAAGCKVIQIEEPTLQHVACFHPENTELIDFLVDALNHEISGLDDVEVWVHTCWGNPNMQKGVPDGSYANAVEIFLDRVNADVWTIEVKDGGRDELKHFAPYRDTMRKKVAIGVVSHRTLQVETPQEVAELTREALRFIAPEKLILSSDCGFGRQGCNRAIAFYKATSIAQGANIVRRELGLPERYVVAADPRLQVEEHVDAGSSPLLGSFFEDEVRNGGAGGGRHS